ncbi:TPA: hypothetical protein ACGO0I_001877 [Streptococcus suis]
MRRSDFYNCNFRSCIRNCCIIRNIFYYIRGSNFRNSNECKLRSSVI